MFLEPWTVVSIMSLSSDDEMSDEEPSTVETVEKYPKETLNVDSTASIPVAVGEMENLTDVILLSTLRYSQGVDELVALSA